MSAPAWDSNFPFVHEESHLMGHGCRMWPIKIKTQTKHLLCKPKVFVIFLSLPTQIPRQYHKLGQPCFLPHPFWFVIQ